MEYSLRILIPGLVLIFFLSQPAYSWRSYDRFHVGAEADGVGSAFVGDASSEIAAHHNPAGLAQVDKSFSLNYEVYTSVIIDDLLATPPRLDFDSFSFFSLYSRVKQWHFSLSLNTLFNSFGTDQLYARGLKLSVAYPLFKNLSIGGGLGPVLLMESSGWGYAFHYNLGVLWQISPRLKWGLSFHSPFSTTWQQTVLGNQLSESFPWLLETGISWVVSPRSILYFSLDYTGIDTVSFVLDNVDSSPQFGGNIWYRLHPHIGYRFLEPRTGAHLSVGLQSDSDYYETGSVQQYQLSLGVRFYGKRAVFNASLIDSLLISLIYPENNHEEKMNFSVSVELN